MKNFLFEKKKNSFTLAIFAFLDFLEEHFSIATLSLENVKVVFKKYKTKNTCPFKIEDNFI